ncbi:MAG TPA: hypothetical protein VGT03_12015 [Candidatus Acidoferrales bacterium]|nr:hypothetical protein [Candidatus Acidoferrales bacterium]
MKRAPLIVLLAAVLAGALGLAYIHHSDKNSPQDEVELSPLGTGAPGAPSSGGPAIQQEQLALVRQLPAGASAVVFADVSQIRASAFAKELAELAQSSEQDPQYTAFVRATGFDYSRDLDRAAMALWPRTAPTSVVALAEGRFDRKRIANYAMQQGRVVRDNGREVYEFPEQGSNRIIRIAFLAPNRLALADGPGLVAVLKSAETNRLDPTMSERVAQVAGTAFFSAARTENLAQDIGLDESKSPQLAHMLKSVRSITLAGQPEADNLNISANAICDSALDALQLMTVLDGLRWMGRAALADPKLQQQMGPQWRPLDELLKAASLSRSGRTLRLRVQLTEQMLAVDAGPATGSTPAH